MLAPAAEELKSFYGMMHYHMGWVDEQFRPALADSGKRVRPVLCLLCCEACGGRFASALPLAGAVELLHCFSLVHDDIQDRSAVRRHRPTVWQVWGEAHGINVGDGLYAAAHASLYRLEQAFGAGLALQVAECFEETALRLCEGQYLDMAFEAEPEVSRDQYTTMIDRKTAALLGFAAWGGARLGGADDALARCYREMGRRIGLAFQIQDDLLGIWGAEGETGKSASSDIASGKKTLPLLMALEALPAAGAGELRRIYSSAESQERDVARARELIEDSGAQERCASLVEEYHSSALRLLEEANPLPAAGEALRELIQRLAGRSQ